MARHFSLPHHLRALAPARGGTAALEFALVAPILVLMQIFLIEMGLDLFAQETLDYGLQTAARSVQIGQAQNAGSAAAFKAVYVCPALNGLLDCNAISINLVTVVGDYYNNAVVGAVPLNAAGLLDTTRYKFCPGQPNALMIAEAVYTAPTVLGRLIPAMATPTAGGQVHVTLSSAAFINENFPVTASVPAGC